MTVSVFATPLEGEPSVSCFSDVKWQNIQQQQQGHQKHNISNKQQEVLFELIFTFSYLKQH
jgi:hypothetical protein